MTGVISLGSLARAIREAFGERVADANVAAATRAHAHVESAMTGSARA